ncbi:MAG: metallophosphoesterase [Rhodocyclaceae bacterium]|nr:MAG: metallophosphoesterase [Rhodocyclaceae bacterium]TND05137.1 MAG: metallophosphoesterase [Rhodocyclaceae bacterium]
MRIAVVSDIHGNLAALQAVVEDFGRRGVDAVFNLGDSLSGPLLPRETAQFLMAQDWAHLGGNHERQVLNLNPQTCDPSDAYTRGQLGAAELDWIALLKPFHRYSEEIFLCHGTPDHDAEYFLESVEPGRLRAATQEEVGQRLGAISAAVVVCGHTHVPRLMRSARGQMLVNPGSVGQPAWDDDQPCYHAVENGAPDARYAIIEKQDSRWSAQLIAVSYDHEAMAALARRNGRPDWEYLLRTGYMPRPASSASGAVR